MISPTGDEVVYFSYTKSINNPFRKRNTAQMSGISLELSSLLSIDLAWFKPG
jgi:hypothetical protein